VNSQTQKSIIQGPAGALEIALDLPAGDSRGVAVIAHPHPLFAGTMDNKVVQTLARAFVLISTLKGVGMAPGVLRTWLGAWAVSWAIAFPVSLVVLPLVRKATAFVVEAA